MLQKLTSFILITLLFSVGSVNLAYASNSKEEKDAALAAKVKEGISKLALAKLRELRSICGIKQN
jgi:hypothetical protein